jgi:hypothetical protein
MNFTTIFMGGSLLLWLLVIAVAMEFGVFGEL